ncbi:unnamed protein product [Polarella glacialis]|uniref:Uncharacterized protein n=1 Tax=Polarella glacialis TaxID=89957 RepID=A0A813LXR2_POLGL|nr:unnamed protein product [Polarella glacialis]
MFGDSPSQEAESQILGDLWDTPPDVEACANEGKVSGGSGALSANDAPAGFGGHVAACAAEWRSEPGVRLAIWFQESFAKPGQEVPIFRVSLQEEEALNCALATALAAPAQRRFRGNFGPAAAAQLHADFAAALGARASTSALKCVPLEGQLQHRLPKELLGDPRVSALRLPQRKRSGGAELAGSALHRAKTVVEEILGGCGPVVFKIGITCNPLVRWSAYEREGYQQFHLLHVTDSSEVVQLFEAALIAAFQDRAGCRNIARGGEGPVGRVLASPSLQCFVRRCCLDASMSSLSNDSYAFLQARFCCRHTFVCQFNFQRTRVTATIHGFISG